MKQKWQKFKAAGAYYKSMLTFWAGATLLTTPIGFAQVCNFSVDKPYSIPFIVLGIFSPLALCGIWRKVMDK